MGTKNQMLLRLLGWLATHARWRTSRESLSAYPDKWHQATFRPLRRQLAQGRMRRDTCRNISDTKSSSSLRCSALRANDARMHIPTPAWHPKCNGRTSIVRPFVRRPLWHHQLSISSPMFLKPYGRSMTSTQLSSKPTISST